MTDIFISYASEDRSRVQPLAQMLAETQGWSVWWDRDIPFGKPFDQVIGEALSAARCVVVVWSTHSVTSGWVIEEAQYGRDRNILVPVSIDDVAIPFGFRRLQAAPLVAWNGKSTSPVFQKLVHDILSILGAHPRTGDNTQTRTPTYTSASFKDRHPIAFSAIVYPIIIIASLGIIILLIASINEFVFHSRWYLQ